MRIQSVENKETFRSQFHLAIGNFLMELVNFVPELINAFLANSVIVWADCFASFAATAHFFIVFLATRQMRSDDGNKYNFGVERLESIISFICDTFLILGYVIVIIVSAVELHDPEQPTKAIESFLILKLLKIAADVFFYKRGEKVQKKHPSRLNETETATLEEKLVEDVVAAVLVSICFFFRDDRWSWYVSPVAAILLSAFFIYVANKRVRESFGEISDASASVADQDKIFDILLEYPSYFEKIKEVNCRYLNHRLLIDIKVVFKKEITYGEEQLLLREISQKTHKDFKNAALRFVIEDEITDFIGQNEG